jgi:hypothetical protein
LYEELPPIELADLNEGVVLEDLAEGRWCGE